MDYKKSLGFDFSPHKTANALAREQRRFFEYINVKLAYRGQPVYGSKDEYPFLQVGSSLLSNVQELNRIVGEHLCPIDKRIQDFLDDYLKEVALGSTPHLPANALILDQHGMARILSIPPEKDSFQSDYMYSYRVKQGVLHNPKRDRRTTKGVFHIVEGGLPVPGDKKEVPKQAFLNLLRHALNPPSDLLNLPFTSTQSPDAQAALFVSLLLRPIVAPEIPGVQHQKSMEVRFLVPGSLVSSLDFVESIFGNAGDPYLPENDSRLDTDHWSGHTGCVILAPHLVKLSKKDLGLPHISNATERQKKDGMCYENEDERYNDGGEFKITCRDHRGIIVTLIADSYFGYCKKEVKTQISYAANLSGMGEEEHAGGAMVFPRYDLGDDFRLNQFLPDVNHSLEELLELLGPDVVTSHPEGYATDRNYPEIIYLPQDAYINLRDQRITWNRNGQPQQLKLLPNRSYIMPSGYKVEMVKPGKGRRWRLIGTTAEGVFCHKPCTVSGGGKSEISKSIANAILGGPVFVANFEEDFKRVEEIVNKEYGERFRDTDRSRPEGRPLLSPDRSLGSVIKLLTPSKEYTDEYNRWLEAIPRYVRDLVVVVKRLYRPEWGDQWKKYFSVDSVNGYGGNELKYLDTPLVTQYLRVGFEKDESWRTFTLRKDFFPSVKWQLEDDISASTIVPLHQLNHLKLNPNDNQYSIKFVENCEYRFFQRPDEAINRGYDQKAESDFSKPHNFFSNYEPLHREDVKRMAEDVVGFDNFTDPMKQAIEEFIHSDKPDYLVCTADPRLVEGKPSKNPRYLQNRVDLELPISRYLAEIGIRLYRRVPYPQPISIHVNAVLPGRRNNPPEPEAGIRSLAVFNPVHFQELPELFMDFVASLTGKSPSTTGAGSEGALTKGPFNALPPILDLNDALVSYLLTEYDAFSTAAGHVGSYIRFDHDLSLVIPEIWARMRPHERSAKYLIEKNYLEKLEDFEYQGKTILASRLGYRINQRFVNTFFGRVFSIPDIVFSQEILQPERQNPDHYADGIQHIVEAQKRVALIYFEDKSIDLACPPLKALLHIMAYDHYEGKNLKDPEIRNLFTRQNLLDSEWYLERLRTKQHVDLNLWKKHVKNLSDFLAQPYHRQEAERLALPEKLTQARSMVSTIQSPAYLETLRGHLGVNPSLRPPAVS